VGIGGMSEGAAAVAQRVDIDADDGYY